MKALLPVSIALAIISASCGGSGEKKIISSEKRVVLKEHTAVVPNRELTLDIKGMSCEHACGGSIRMALKETGAVDRCSFDFETDRAVNKAFITFDKDKISPDRIRSIIEQLNDGQFTTAHPSTKTLEDNTVSETTSSHDNTSPDNITTHIGIDNSYQLPNLYELFSKLLS